MNQLKKTILLILIGSLSLLSSCTKTEEFVLPAPPEIEGISPASGGAGISLYIYGKNFYPSINGNSVSIGDTPVSIFKADTNRLVVIIPAGLESGPVKVNVKNQVVTGPVFTYLPAIVVSTFTGSGLIGLQDGSIEQARFNLPRGLCQDDNGNIYVADQGNNTIRKIAVNGSVITIAGDNAAGFADGISETARFNQPASITFGTDGNLYVADYGNNAIRKVTLSGEVTTLAGNINAGNADGYGANAGFNGPVGIISDVSGNLFVADYLNNIIRKITLQGEVTTFAGTGMVGNANGFRLQVTFAGPAALTFDKSGNLYVADWFNFRIRKIDAQGVVSTYAGSVQGYQDGQGTEAKFNTPVGLSSDNSGNIYVADGFNNLIRKITTDGVVSTFAGSGKPGYRNGRGENAQFDGPIDVLFKSDSSILYVSDYYNHRIRRIDIK